MYFVWFCYVLRFFFFSSRRRHTRCALVTGVQTCALPISSALALLVSGVAGEGARRRELAQLMADHFLIDEDGDELAAVVDVERQPNELRQDRRPARPGLDRCAGTWVLCGLSLLQTAAFGQRTFQNGAGHERQETRRV